MNHVVLTGRAATDCDTREVTGGSKVTSFILAVDRNSEECDFFRVKAWDSQAEATEEQLRRGRQVAVEGALRQDVYTGADGAEHNGVVVVARRLEFL